ncbi:DUF3616 domain-containing protein [Zavarzinia compransoris]|uniref:DUF3616 domain-containing protein n=1 Tax=Zavarzinia compransoris TaxID=1264899 RepID=A0A317E408_9PROT|nr:DUF3616 domain-containing protein [Zavarzinia compransoris]PWR21777.1 hypothetical protein DKG75_07245 [Zavarzinia compransoris]TDP45424.1 uncharacterized protein DUF3616 [Zavarzinia compransoris]
MGIRRGAWGGAVLVAAVLSGPVPAAADDAFPVKGASVGEVKPKGEIKGAKDLSGIACAEAAGFPRRCLIVDDDSQFAQFALLHEDRLDLGKRIRLTERKFGDRYLEFDGEAVAFAGDAFYVLGSHGRPRDKKGETPEGEARAAIEAVSVIQRIALRGTAFEGKGEAAAADVPLTPATGLRPLLSADKEIAPFVDGRLDANGLTIEGLAVQDGALYAGLRAPVLGERKRAVVFETTLAAVFDGAADKPVSHRLDLGGRGIRDIVAYKGAFLILAGPSADPPDSQAIGADDYLSSLCLEAGGRARPPGAGRRLHLQEGRRHQMGQARGPAALRGRRPGLAPSGTVRRRQGRRRGAARHGEEPAGAVTGHFTRQSRSFSSKTAPTRNRPGPA